MFLLTGEHPSPPVTPEASPLYSGQWQVATRVPERSSPP